VFFIRFKLRILLDLLIFVYVARLCLWVWARKPNPRVWAESILHKAIFGMFVFIKGKKMFFFIRKVCLPNTI
jgi:hypothetical protein